MVMKKKQEVTEEVQSDAELNKLYDARDLLLDGFNKALKKVESSTAEANSLSTAIATLEEKIQELGGDVDVAE